VPGVERAQVVATRSLALLSVMLRLRRSRDELRWSVIGVAMNDVCSHQTYRAFPQLQKPIEMCQCRDERLQRLSPLILSLVSGLVANQPRPRSANEAGSVT
jgi:hypothetical protein